MKKLMMVSTWQCLVAQTMKVILVFLVGAGFSIGFWSMAAPKPSPTPKPTPTTTPPPGKCTVCDHDKDKNKDKQIDCRDVDKYLRDHPNSTRGPCQPTPVTNP